MNPSEGQDEPLAIFVYGTLKRGQCRERCWPVRPLSVEDAEVVGLLFDLGPFPALSHGRGRVAGELWRFDAADMAVVLAVLDQIEGYRNAPGDLYRRERVAVRCGVELESAWTYLFADTPPAHALIASELACWPEHAGRSDERVG